MSCINKLVIYPSKDALNQHAANLPCLWNFDPFNLTGNFDDGCGHYANVTFAVIQTNADIANLPPGPFEVIELCGFAIPPTLV